MELRAFAQRLLHGESVADKLFAPPSLTDTEPGVALVGACEPGRSAALVFCPNPTRVGAPMEAPEDPQARGLLLHAFANHELLAIELMALALLRFVDAPPAFRRGIANTIAEEQTHLRLYLGRMQALGVGFGDGPRPGFFWRVMASMASPRDYVAHMALTFEQANLDFANHYAGAFGRLGDTKTAAVLDTVLADEIRHVGFGARWFRRWVPSGTSLFDAHVAALRAPLQIVRAKGSSFDQASRAAAGLPEAYIAALRACGGSKGAPAVVHWFNGHAEHEVEHGLRFTPKATAAAAIVDLETVPMFLARPSDVVLVSAAPSTNFLGQLRAAGFALPRFCEAELHRTPWPAPANLGALAGLQPWGSSPRTAAFGATARARLPSGAVDRSRFAPAWAALYDKRTMARIQRGLLERGEPSWCPVGTSARVANSADELVEHSAAFGVPRVVVKPCFGAAGRGQLRACVPWSPVDLQSARALLRSGPVVVEPFFDVVAQLSIRLDVARAGTSVDGVGRCISDERGQFRAAVVGPYDLGLPAAARRWLCGDGRDPKRVPRMAQAVAAAVHAEAQGCGFEGPAGVDALLVRTSMVEGDASRNDGFALRPIVDLNPRLSMGRVAHAFRGRVGRRSVALWQAVTSAQLESWGWSDFSSWAEALGDAAPVRIDGTQQGRIVSGVLPTTDPARARGCVMALSVGASLDQAATALRGR